MVFELLVGPRLDEGIATLKSDMTAQAVSVVEMAAIFAVAQVRGVRAALIVAVSDELFGHEWKVGFGHDAYLDSLVRAADAAIDAAQILRPT